jgi:hypothetical protein
MDGDLRALLAIEPSPPFEARVRARVAGERQRSAGWMSWRMPAAVAAAAVVVIAAVVVMRSGEEVRPPAPQIVSIQPEQVPSVPVVEAPVVEPSTAKPRPERVVPRPLPAPRVPDRMVTAASLPDSEPEVLVPRDQEETLRRLVAALREGRVDLSTLPPPVEPTASELKELTIPLLTIEPLPVSGGSTSGSGVENSRSNPRSAL